MVTLEAKTRYQIAKELGLPVPNYYSSYNESEYRRRACSRCGHYKDEIATLKKALRKMLAKDSIDQQIDEEFDASL